MKHLREGTGPRPLALWGGGRALDVGWKPRCCPILPPCVCHGASCLATVRPAFLTSKTGFEKKTTKVTGLFWEINRRKQSSTHTQ